MKRIKYISLAVLALTSLNTFAISGDPTGRGVGNGGGVCVCRDKQDNKKIISAKMIDLLEAKANGFTIDEKLIPASEYIFDQSNLFEKRLGNSSVIGSKIFNTFTEIPKNIVWLTDSSQLLTPTSDSSTYTCETSDEAQVCKYEQLANFTNDGELKVSLEIYKNLDALNKFAFTLHETIYYLDRIYNEATNSDNTKKLVAAFFSTLKQEEVTKIFVNNFGGSICKNENCPELTEYFFKNIEDGNILQVDKSLRQGTSINIKDKNGASALIRAINSQEYFKLDELIKYLIRKGIDINAQDFLGNTALHYAIEKDSVELVKLLIKNGANPKLQNFKDGNNILIQLIEKRVDSFFTSSVTYDLFDAILTTFQERLGQFANSEITELVNAKNKYGHFALEILSRSNNSYSETNIKLIKSLLLFGAKPTGVYDYSGYSPIYRWIEAGQNDLIKFVVKKKIEFNPNEIIKASWGQVSLLSRAASINNTVMFYYLLQAGADVKFKDSYGKTSYDYAKKNNNYEIKYMIENKTR